LSAQAGGTTTKPSNASAQPVLVFIRIDLFAKEIPLIITSHSRRSRVPLSSPVVE
jgi:hypothetical protein